MSSLNDKIRQYGIKNFLIRGFKAFVRILGFKYEKFILMVKDLDDYVKPPNPKISVHVQELNYENFKNSNFLKFDPDRLPLFKKRFSCGNYIALGAYHQNRLVYTCWISLKNFESSINTKNHLRLNENEGLLIDAYAHPEIRGLGVHTYMNAIRVNKLYDLKKEKAIVLVMMENLPARKAQSKIGFREGKIVLYIKIFTKEIVKIKHKKIKL
ncbi:MAG: hypothetical protein ACFFDN_08465 [Candidatus Hodarchaeota archaeon]